MRWSILIISVEERREHLARMLAELVRQAAPFEGDVNVLVYVDDFERNRAQARQLLVDVAEAEYVNFVDDDDEVAPDYVARLYAAMQEGPDMVGFRLQAWMDGMKLKPSIHSLHCPGWLETEHAYYRDISHLNPIRRELMAAVPFPDVEFEDYHWAIAMGRAGVVRTEAFVDGVMYLYRYETRRTLTRLANRTHRRSDARLPVSELLEVLTPADIVEVCA